MNKLKEIYNILYKEYGNQGWWPLYNYKTKIFEYINFNLNLTESQKLEIILGSILTQNTSWKNVEKALKNLIENNYLSKSKLKSIDNKQLALLIKSSGYHNQKAKKIKEFLKFSKKITRNNLLSIWGIGKETADSILLYAYKHPIFVIDSYTKKIFNRLGFKQTTYDELQYLFHKSLKKNHKLFNEYHALLVEHGKRYCKAKPLCQSCPLNRICTFYNTKA